MENIAPNLILLWDVLWALERGLPVTNGVQSFLQRGAEGTAKSAFQVQIEMWWRARLRMNRREETSDDVFKYDKSRLSVASRQLLFTIELGLQGESILAQLKTLESEMLLGCDEEIQTHAALLPLKMMVPLFGLIFPSFFILLVVPLLKMLQF